MSDLVAFLRARLGEDEVRARVLGANMDTARVRDQSERVAKVYGDPNPPEAEVGLVDSLWWNVRDLADYADMFSPARMLADVEVKRRLIAIVEQALEFHPAATPQCPNNERCACRECSTIRVLALPYAAHPDYDPAWRP